MTTLLASLLVAAVMRQFPAVTVPEGESIPFNAGTAVGLQSDNTSVAVVTAPEGNKATLTGVRLGTTQVTYLNAMGPYAVAPVTVVPTYWPTLLNMFQDDPEITAGIIGNKVVISGKTGDVESLKRVQEAQQLDSGRIITQVSYSQNAVAALVKAFTERMGYTNIAVSVVGNEVCLAGKLFDEAAITTVTKRVEAFVKDYKVGDNPGLTVNGDALKIIKQRILISVEFIEYDTDVAKSLGVEWPQSISAYGSGTYGLNWSKTWNSTRSSTDTGSFTSSRNSSSSTSSGTTTTSGSTASGNSLSYAPSIAQSLAGVFGQNAAFSAGISQFTMTLHMMMGSGSARSTYKTQLATQSGEEVQFQNGGTLHRSTTGVYTSDLKQIEYGFIVKAKPLILDDNTVSLDVSLENKDKPVDKDSGDIEVPCYTTKSKYLLRPGEQVVLSGFTQQNEEAKEQHVPWLGRIPIIGWLFRTESGETEHTENVMVVTINWVTENTREESLKQYRHLRDLKVEVER